MLPFLRVGPLLIQLPGLALLAGIWIGTNTAEKEANRLRLKTPAVVNMILYGLIGGLLGARLLYALEHLSAYVAAPLSLLAISGTALDLWGGLLVGAAVATIYGRRKGLPLRPTLDALAPGFAVVMIALGAANILSGNGYGSPLKAPWAIYLWGEYRHPTQMYETVLACAVYLGWRFMQAGSMRPGSRFWLVVGLSAAARLFTEAFHGDSLSTIGGFRLAQVLALLFLLAALYMGRRRSDAGDVDEYLAGGVSAADSQTGGRGHGSATFRRRLGRAPPRPAPTPDRKTRRG